MRSQVEAALDSWPGRASTRDAILRIDRDPVPALIDISKEKRESELRIAHAINLLATFKSQQSEHALGQIAKHGTPKFRCLALRALAELNSGHAIPVLINKLDDHAVCMTIVSTDPPKESGVYVSDGAVCLLEQINGQSFDRETTESHRAAKPWKDWWAKEKAIRSASPMEKHDRQ